MRAGVVLVHGYTGSPGDLDPLARELTGCFGKDSVKQVLLPGHSGNGVPAFDALRFRSVIIEALETFLKEGRAVVGLGHSTGGNLLLSTVHEYGIDLAGLVLVSVPRKIDTGYRDRWENHRTGEPDIPFRSLAGMVTLINMTARQSNRATVPTFILHGEKDRLVPPSEAFEWRKQLGPDSRVTIVPSAGHDVFNGHTRSKFTDLVLRAVHDALLQSETRERDSLERLIAIEPDLQRFANRNPDAAGHVLRCPSGRVAAGLRPELGGIAENEPVFANIEITTRCNLECRYCGRSIWDIEEDQMEMEVFKELLTLLPNTYRITLVGLGEPLLHPRVVDFVAEASSRGCRVTVVTNGTCLSPSLSRELIRAGVRCLAFSMDAPNQEMSQKCRMGTDFEEVVSNVRRFVECSKKTDGVATAVFTAVSKETAPYLESLADVVGGLGVRGLMVTDLNFERNQTESLAAHTDADTRKHLKDFIGRALSRNLALLSVRGLEAFGIEKRFLEYLVRSPAQIFHRSSTHTWCHSPWQTMPIGVKGEVSICDCLPRERVGNLLELPIRGIWNGARMVRHRTAMLSSDPPAACRICPRF